LDSTRVQDKASLAALRDTGVLVFLSLPYSPDFTSIEDVFPVGRSWLRRYSRPEQFNALPML